MSAFEGLARGFSGILQGDKAQDAAKRRKQEEMALIERMNWDPSIASDFAPTYQRSQSPVARAYIESFLLGNNPDATFSGAPNAAFTKGAQQTAQNAMFGTPEARAAQSQKILTETPWKVNPRAPVRSNTSGNAYGGGGVGVGANQSPAQQAAQRFKMEYPLLAQAGVTPDEHREMLASGFLNGVESWKHFTTFNSGLDNFKKNLEKHWSTFQNESAGDRAREQAKQRFSLGMMGAKK